MREFAEMVALEINAKTELNAQVFGKDMPDGSKFYGVTIRRANEDIAPTIYLEDFAKEGLSVEETAKRVVDIYDEQKINMPDLSFFTDWEKAKELITFRLMPATFNAEVYRNAGRYGFDDLILVPYVKADISGIDGSIKVLNQHIKNWGVSKTEVMNTALKNTKNADVFIQSLGEFTAEHLGFDGDIPEELLGPVIVTNKEMAFGAAAIIAKLSEFKKKFKEGFVVIPSSIHEVLVVPKKCGMDMDYINAMIGDVNDTSVFSTERLSNHAYEF